MRRPNPPHLPPPPTTQAAGSWICEHAFGFITSSVVLQENQEKGINWLAFRPPQIVKANRVRRPSECDLRKWIDDQETKKDMQRICKGPQEDHRPLSWMSALHCH